MKQRPTFTPKRGLLGVFAQGEAPDANTLLAKLAKGIEEFKTEKTQEIADLQAKLAKTADSESVQSLTEKLTAAEAALNALNEQFAAAQLNGGTGKPDKDAQAHAEAVLAFMRRGEERAELKKSDSANGGYLVPDEWDRSITDKLQEFSPLRRIFHVQTVSTPHFEKLYNLHGATSGWVGEEDARNNTNTPTFKQLKFETGEIYANPAATQQILDDAEINLEKFLAEEVQAEFSLQENKAFISGDGEKGKPFGLLTYVEGATNANKHPFGAIKTVKSGSANGLTADSIIDLVYDLPAKFSQGAVFIMNRKTLAAVRKLKDSTNNYLWQPSLQTGQPSTLLGYPCYEVAEMPDVAANALPIAFGDMKRAYMVLDRKGVSILRDPYTRKPFVQFYTTKRTGGGVNNPEAVRLLKIAA
ncbi:phage major capsid protein [Conchiformibius kuhniae]|uniref:Phage major capsid protein n=1 Tax=Conchiformibius kuhniae TaxID=211502 RepID=A0A8T9MTX3_9NEIS|nr:phage major capsid protein [Conchiformibius kuhniae]UOP05330.1 phage major capsid protein [Conchiformibius kuhniae]